MTRLGYQIPGLPSLGEGPDAVFAAVVTQAGRQCSTGVDTVFLMDVALTEDSSCPVSAQ